MTLDWRSEPPENAGGQQAGVRPMRYRCQRCGRLTDYCPRDMSQRSFLDAQLPCSGAPSCQITGEEF